MLYACDFAWWKQAEGAPEFGGLKLSQDPSIILAPQWDIKRVKVVKDDDRLLLDKPGIVGWGGNSGFHVLNLAVQFGAAKIILVGYDMTLSHGIHWHGRHVGLHNPTSRNVDRWRRCIDDVAEAITALGVTVINVSPISALANYPKMTLTEALAC